MRTGKQYDEEFKKQAIKLAKEVGNTAAAPWVHGCARQDQVK